MDADKKYKKQMKRIGLNIKYYRSLRNLNQSTLAERIGVSEQHLSRIENGSATKLSTLFALAEELDITIVQLFENISEK